MTQRLAIFIGRFQIFHQAHLQIIRQALTDCDRLLLLVGSAFRARNVKNPFTFEERAQLISNNLKAVDKQEGTDFAERIIIKPLEDQMYNEQRWIDSVNAYVNETLKEGESPILVGHYKDSSSYYLEHFNTWARIEYKAVGEVNATALRAALYENTFEQLPAIKAWLPEATQRFLEQFVETSEFLRLQEEHEFIKSYRAEWACTPYPVLFVTTDAVVTCCDHLLLIQRGHCPGKGLWALPGGFLEAEEWVQQGLIRELQEETQIDVAETALNASLQGLRVFDHPGRSQIGRVITHSGWFKLEHDTLPDVQAADDAKLVKWVPLAELEGYKDKMHDDHFLIIKKWLAL